MSSPIGTLPGITAEINSVEKIVGWGREVQLLYVQNLVMDSTVTDSGSTPTTALRAGLVLGKQTSDGNLYAWDADATDGTQFVHSVLSDPLDMLDIDGTAVDKTPTAIQAGPVKPSEMLIQGTAFVSNADEQEARRQMAGRFLFDDDIQDSVYQSNPPEILITDKTLTAADNGKLFICTTADVDLTLPALAAGYSFKAYRVDDFELKITSPEGNNMIALNDATATSVAATTANLQTGASIEVESVYISTGVIRWIVRTNGAGDGITITVV